MKEQAILNTLNYADIFDYPLTRGQIHQYLEEPLPTKTLKTLLARMVTEGKLTHLNGFYCLPGREEIIKLRKRREVYSQAKIRKARRVAAILGLIPWIRLVGITGSLAMENASKNDDIDLMIITTPRRLWLTRGLVVILLRLSGQYRRPKKIKDRICPNLMLSEEALQFPDHDLFIAHEIAHMKPILNRGCTYQKFLKANLWVRNFLPNAIKIPGFEYRTPKSHGKGHNFLLDFLEKLAYKVQLGYMGKKKTTEVTTPSLIRFHPQDMRPRILREYRKRLTNTGYYKDGSNL